MHKDIFVFLCVFVSLWLVVTSERPTVRRRPYKNACQAKRLTMPTAMTISTIAAMIMLLM